ncbi:hypothetical protein LAJ19_10810 [Deinococcus taeanensis]|uniref:hypothetical protein n=1 Tax=Deinococcus taeanensis TaxID=2737050 RepID=UPI001CDC8B61|nr:hypothetical protein [Deinococcus taeanensis]UBV42119.1 hypothetical protein LAJ19_10810 [Deinococcus taeanensis]
MKYSFFPLLLSTGALLTTAHASTAVQGSLARDLDVKPGQVIQVPITLRNSGTAAETVRVSIEDVRALPGTTTYLQPGQLDRSNALWIKLPATLVTVPANSTKSFNVTISVPQEVAPGTHWSAVIVQPDRQPSASKGGVIVNTRYAINLITTLAGGNAKIRFASPNLERQPEGVNLGVKVFNDGNAVTFPQYRAEVYDPQGKLVARNEVGKIRLYPGGGVQLNFNFGKLTSGKYTFLVMANDGVNPVVGTRYNVSLGN